MNTKGKRVAGGNWEIVIDTYILLLKKVGKNSENISCSVASYCDPMDCSLPGSSFHGILQARILEWLPLSCSRGSS